MVSTLNQGQKRSCGLRRPGSLRLHQNCGRANFQPAETGEYSTGVDTGKVKKRLRGTGCGSLPGRCAAAEIVLLATVDGTLKARRGPLAIARLAERRGQGGQCGEFCKGKTMWTESGNTRFLALRLRRSTICALPRLPGIGGGGASRR